MQQLGVKKEVFEYKLNLLLAWCLFREKSSSVHENKKVLLINDGLELRRRMMTSLIQIYMYLYTINKQ